MPGGARVVQDFAEWCRILPGGARIMIPGLCRFCWVVPVGARVVPSGARVVPFVWVMQGYAGLCPNNTHYFYTNFFYTVHNFVQKNNRVYCTLDMLHWSFNFQTNELANEVNVSYL